MPAALPTTDCLNKTGYVFGIGTYDSPGDSSIDDDDLDHGVVALPPEARGDLSFLTDDMLYTEDEGRDITMNTFEPTLVRLRTSANSLPGDLDRPPKGSSNKEKSYKYQMVSGNGTSIEPYDGEFIYDARTSATELPHDEYTERAAVGYSDNTHTGNKKRTAEAELPGPTDNYQSLDNLLGALGNFWSG